jgi:hypothetical protein
MTNRTEIQIEALDRARNGQSVANFAAIYEGFAAKGIAETDIRPRENVLTFNAWKALGRSVKKGEHGVKVCTFIDVPVRNTADAGDDTARSYRKPHVTTVFHISQTETTAERETRFATRAPRRSVWGSGHGRYPSVDPGELAADRWNEQHGDRF